MVENTTKIKIYGENLSITSDSDGAKIISEGDNLPVGKSVPGKGISSTELNTILRQNSFVICALVKAINEIHKKDFGPGNNISALENEYDNLVWYFKNSLVGPESIDSTKLSDDAVISDKIEGAAVVESKIANGAVATDKIANGAVTRDKIRGGAVTTEKLANNAVTTGEIADKAITASKLGDIIDGEFKTDSDNGLTVSLMKNDNGIGIQIGGVPQNYDTSRGNIKTKFDEISKKIEKIEETLSNFCIYGKISYTIPVGHVQSPMNECVRLGDYCIINFSGDVPYYDPSASGVDRTITLQLPVGFRPVSDTFALVSYQHGISSGSLNTKYATASITTDGRIIITTTDIPVNHLFGGKVEIYSTGFKCA